ncbi:unnamed protein product [Diabrotica balteata]|uniref:Uncharacterized protein n=1 Tax=Diabrotica balteata TaxID=107213 RepID=A0A9N9X7X3_DIABA|nr:unnamed protein product [Diabrotica balteata]
MSARSKRLVEAALSSLGTKSNNEKDIMQPCTDMGNQKELINNKDFIEEHRCRSVPNEIGQEIIADQILSSLMLPSENTMLPNNSTSISEGGFAQNHTLLRPDTASSENNTLNQGEWQEWVVRPGFEKEFVSTKQMEVAENEVVEMVVEENEVIEMEVAENEVMEMDIAKELEIVEHEDEKSEEKEMQAANNVELEVANDISVFTQEIEIENGGEEIGLEKQVIEDKLSQEEGTEIGDRKSVTSSDSDGSLSFFDKPISRISKKRLKAKKRRVSGLSYTGYKKKKSDRSFLCNLISENERKSAFKTFWNFSTWSEKKAFVKGLVSTRHIRRRRKKTENNAKELKKNVGHDIFLPRSNGEKVKVCRLFFINTLNLGEDTFRRWVRRSEVDTAASEDSEGSIGDKGVSSPRSKKKPRLEGRKENTHKEMTENVSRWLELLPKPRKDQCDVCCGYEVKTVALDVYQNHIVMKNEAREAKNAAKSETDDSHLVLTIDLQSVLLCPKTEASRMFYKQKLQLHNFTIFVLNNKDVSLYVWHESNGGVSSNEFTSCIVDFLSSKLDIYKKFTIISDGCNYQNRNKVLASALSDLAIQKNILIQQLFLEKGHTMMECDSVHATLEKYFVPPINSPSDYIAQMRNARPKQPYNIKKLPSNIQSLRPGKKAGDPTVTDLRALEYRPDGEILFKLRHSDPYKLLPQRRLKLNVIQRPTQLYLRPIPITESKWKCLQDLKLVLERDHHSFYDNLPYQPDKKTKNKH